MDIQEMISMLLGSAQSDPSILGNLVEHPYSTIRNVTGVQDISREQASQVVAGTAAAARGQKIDMGSLAGIASAMLGQSDNSVHSLAEMLLGSGSSYGVDMSQGVGTDILSNILGLSGSMFGGAPAQQRPVSEYDQGYDAGYQAGYYDGYQVAIDEMRQQQRLQQRPPAPPQRQTQSQGYGGLDFGSLANMLFGGM